jgi:hypothetical protein
MHKNADVINVMFMKKEIVAWLIIRQKLRKSRF